MIPGFTPGPREDLEDGRDANTLGSGPGQPLSLARLPPLLMLTLETKEAWLFARKKASLHCGEKRVPGGGDMV